MSRIGKQPVIIPSGVEVKIDGSNVHVKGKKGELYFSFDHRITIALDNDKVIVTRSSDEKEERALHGMTRALIQNMIVGAKDGFEKRLEIIGVGYRALANGKKITLSLGFSHPVELTAPEGITIVNDQEKKQILIISGIDKQKVGQFASEIRSLRKPEPYKGKGIRYVDEYVFRKAGKSASKKK